MCGHMTCDGTADPVSSRLQQIKSHTEYLSVFSPRLTILSLSVLVPPLRFAGVPNPVHHYSWGTGVSSIAAMTLQLSVS